MYHSDVLPPALVTWRAHQSAADWLANVECDNRQRFESMRPGDMADAEPPTMTTASVPMKRPQSQFVASTNEKMIGATDKEKSVRLAKFKIHKCVLQLMGGMSAQVDRFRRRLSDTLEQDAQDGADWADEVAN